MSFESMSQPCKHAAAINKSSGISPHNISADSYDMLVSALRPGRPQVDDLIV
jgi:hypothetical protein